MVKDDEKLCILHAPLDQSVDKLISVMRNHAQKLSQERASCPSYWQRVEYDYILGCCKKLQTSRYFGEPTEELCFRAEGDPRPQIQYQPSGDLSGQYNSVFKDVISAINGQETPNVRSYSKSLVVALFKYIGKSPSTNSTPPVLAVKYLKANTLTLTFKIDHLDWIREGTVNGVSGVVPRTVGYVKIDIPINDINNKNAILKSLPRQVILDAVSNTRFYCTEKCDMRYHIDMDRIHTVAYLVGIQDFTISAYNMTKKKLELPCFLSRGEDGVYEKIWSHKSFATDMEILSSVDLKSDEILDRNTTEYLRLLTLFKIFCENKAYEIFKRKYAPVIVNAYRTELVTKHLEAKNCSDELLNDYREILCKTEDSMIRNLYCVTNFTRSALKDVLNRLHCDSKRPLSNEDMYNYAVSLLS